MLAGERLVDQRGLVELRRSSALMPALPSCSLMSCASALLSGSVVVPQHDVELAAVRGLHLLRPASGPSSG